MKRCPEVEINFRISRSYGNYGNCNLKIIIKLRVDQFLRGLWG